jgi:hypothetical protein
VSAAAAAATSVATGGRGRDAHHERPRRLRPPLHREERPLEAQVRDVAEGHVLAHVGAAPPAAEEDPTVGDDEQPARRPRPPGDEVPEPPAA